MSKNQSEHIAKFARIQAEYAGLRQELRRLSRRKPREEDGRRKFDFSSDMTFWERYRELGSQSALAQEIGISRQAVKKRLDRIRREQLESGRQLVAMMEFWGVFRVEAQPISAKSRKCKIK